MPAYTPAPNVRASLIMAVTFTRHGWNTSRELKDTGTQEQLIAPGQLMVLVLVLVREVVESLDRVPILLLLLLGFSP